MRIASGGVAVCLGAVVTIACGAGDGGDAAPPPDVDPMAPVMSIGTTELGELCDWSNAQLGGYGRMETCAGGLHVHTFASHDVCVAHPFPSTCPATVGQVEDCVTAMAHMGASLCALSFSTPAACRALVPSCAIVFG